MKIRPPWLTGALGWCLLYLLTSVAAVALNSAVGWQYDGDLGWWLVMVYSLPALALSSAIWVLVNNDDVSAIYSLLKPSCGRGSRASVSPDDQEDCPASYSGIVATWRVGRSDRDHDACRAAPIG